MEDALRQSIRITENLTCIKDAVIAQQNALAEQRARAAKGDYYEDDYNGLHDDYKGSGGFVGGDAKKRRGVSTPSLLAARRGETDNLAESCTSRTLSQLQPSGNSRVEERTGRCSHPLQCMRTALRQVDRKSVV